MWRNLGDVSCVVQNMLGNACTTNYVVQLACCDRCGAIRLRQSMCNCARQFETGVVVSNVAVCGLWRLLSRSGRFKCGHLCGRPRASSLLNQSGHLKCDRFGAARPRSGHTSDGHSGAEWWLLLDGGGRRAVRASKIAQDGSKRASESPRRPPR